MITRVDLIALVSLEYAFAEFRLRIEASFHTEI